MRVVGLEIAQRVAPLGAVAVGDLHSPQLAHRRRQIDERIVRAFGQVERRRMIGVAGDREGRAVLEDSGGGGEREPAGREQVAVDRHLDHAPRVRAQRGRARPQHRFRPAVLLLEVLGAKEHSFLPDDPVGPRHVSAKR